MKEQFVEAYKVVAALGGLAIAIVFALSLMSWFFPLHGRNPEMRVFSISVWVTILCSAVAIFGSFSYQYVFAEGIDWQIVLEQGVLKASTIWIISWSVWKWGWSRRAFASSMLGIVSLLFVFLLADELHLIKTSGISSEVFVFFSAGSLLVCAFIWKNLVTNVGLEERDFQRIAQSTGYMYIDSRDHGGR